MGFVCVLVDTDPSPGSVMVRSKKSVSVDSGSTVHSREPNFISSAISWGKLVLNSGGSFAQSQICTASSMSLASRMRTAHWIRPSLIPQLEPGKEDDA